MSDGNVPVTAVVVGRRRSMAEGEFDPVSNDDVTLAFSSPDELRMYDI